MTVEGRHAGEFILSEANGHRSRQTVTLEGGFTDAGKLAAGTVLGKLTSGSKYVVSPNSGADGSQIAAGILLDNVDLAGGDVDSAIIARAAEVNGNCLSYDASVDDDSKKATKATQLAAIGIIVR